MIWRQPIDNFADASSEKSSRTLRKLEFRLRSANRRLCELADYAIVA